MASLSNFLNKKVLVTQVKSNSKLTAKQKANLVGLGLSGIGTSASVNFSREIAGMVNKVSHIVKLSLL